MDQKLLLIFDMFDDINVDLKSVGHNIVRRQGEPLSQRDIGHAVTLVQLDPHQLLGVRGVFDVVT